MRGDTIFALSSGALPSAIAVVRMSGPHVRAACAALLCNDLAPRQAMLRTLTDPQSLAPIDRGLVVFFPGPASFTGEDCVEFQVHGGRAVVQALFSALSRCAGCRPAEAGEFTRRAFANGRLDLTEAEGLADLLAADTEAQRAQAFASATGALRLRAQAWRAHLLDAMASVEAHLDFSDEGDVPDAIAPGLGSRLDKLIDELDLVLAEGRRGERMREGFTILLAGPPNAGKSTLLNALAKRDVAIVSPQAGTTRDIIEVHLDLGGLPVVLVDTAGLRASDDSVEREGMRRTRLRAESAELILWLSPRDQPSEIPRILLSGPMASLQRKPI